MTAKAHYENFSGKALRERMELKGIRMYDVAREMKISSVMVSDWQRGKAIPSFQQFVELSLLLGCTPQALTFDGQLPKFDYLPHTKASANLDLHCKCGNPARFACDKIIAGGKLCSEPLCRNCATQVGPDQHLCPKHAGAKK